MLKKFAGAFAIAVLMTPIVFAQSSGSANYNYTSPTTVCTDVSGTLSGAPDHGVLNTGLKVSSGNGNAVIIRPSAVTGLLTDVTMTTKDTSNGISSASAQAAIQFNVTVKPLSGQALPTVEPNPNPSLGINSATVTYDDRFLQISTNLFTLLGTTCAVTTTNPNGCTFSVDETTLSAHSFDFVASNLSAGDYEISVSWSAPVLTGSNSLSSAMACAGPVMITAEQVKVFNQSSGISF